MKTIKQIHEGFYKNTSSGIEGRVREIKERLKVVLRNYDDFCWRDTGELREDCITINPDLTVTILQTAYAHNVLELSPDEKGIGFQFESVNTKSIHIQNSKATNLTGLPIDYDGHLRIEHCNNLQYISDNGYGCKGGLYITGCDSLKSIKGMTQIMNKGGINISECKNLTSLDGCAKQIDRDFRIVGCGLKSLKGAPQKMIDGSTCTITHMDSLKSIKYLPKGAIIYSLDYLDGITKLEDCPQKCSEFDCRGCNSLTSLEGAPRYVARRFSCCGCKSLKSLEGGPIEVGRFDCGDTPITSLVGAPEKCRWLDCEHCEELISLEGFPKEVNGDFRYYGCKNLKFKKSEIQPFVNGKITRASN